MKNYLFFLLLVMTPEIFGMLKVFQRLGPTGKNTLVSGQKRTVALLQTYAPDQNSSKPKKQEEYLKWQSEQVEEGAAKSQKEWMKSWQSKQVEDDELQSQKWTEDEKEEEEQEESEVVKNAG